MQDVFEPVRHALYTVHQSTSSADERKLAEAVLSDFRSQPASLGWAVQSLQQHSILQQPEVALFAAQTLRHRVCEDGHALEQPQRDQLRHLLVGILASSPSVGGSAIIRLICLALAALAALDLSYDPILEVTAIQLPQQNTLELLQLLAEEGCGDWRHVALPGVFGSKQLDWATETRQRFRSWSPAVLQLLHGGPLQQEQYGNGELSAKRLSCLTAWVKLGALHVVESHVAEQAVQIGLLAIQSVNEQVAAAAVDLFQELSEYAPEQLLLSLQPHMITVAKAACQAAARGGATDLMRAAAWVKAFAAYAAAGRQKLVKPLGDAQGPSVSDALLQVSVLPQLSAGGFVCLPALEAWVSLLEDDVLTEGGAAGDASQLLPPDFVRSCLLLLLSTAANWLQWQQDSSTLHALEDDGMAIAVRDVFQLSCSVLGGIKYLAVVAYIWTGAGYLQEPRLQQPQLNQQAPGRQLQQTSTSSAGGSLIPGALEQAEADALPAWQQQQLYAALRTIAAAPAALRLHAAVMLLAASADRRAVAGGLKMASHTDQSAAGTQHCIKAGTVVVPLLSSAAAAMRQAGGTAGGDVVQQQQPGLNFCLATKAWSAEVVCHFSTLSAAAASSDMAGLLQLLLTMAGNSATGAVAAEAVRAVVTTALEVKWQELHRFAPMIMQVSRTWSLPRCCEQDLLASLSACLAAPGMNKQQEQHAHLRAAAAEQLIQPALVALDALLQQLQSGALWASLAPTADSWLCYHLAQARAVLEACLLVQKSIHQQNQQPAADADDDEDVDMDGWHDGSGAQAQQAPAMGRMNTAAAVAACDPAIQLLLNKLWPQLHRLVTEYNASGEFLHHYGKCCSRLLMIHPSLLMPQLQQFLQVASVSMARPGGCSLAEPFSAVLVLCCRQAPDMLLQSEPLIMQALSQLCLVPDVSGLMQHGAGDQWPDLAEHVLKLYTALVKHGTALQQYSSTGQPVTEQALATAVSCASCCHRKVATCALALLSTVLAAASTEGPQQHVLIEMVAKKGSQVIQGVLGALLAPSPLPLP